VTGDKGMSLRLFKFSDRSVDEELRVGIWVADADPDKARHGKAGGGWQQGARRWRGERHGISYCGRLEVPDLLLLE
jgi:hypothetical protein